LVRAAGRRAWLAALSFLLSGAALAQPRTDAPPARVQVCAGCHGEGGVSRTPGIPSIAGQPRIFLENLLVLVREGVRGTETMQRIMSGATDPEIIALAKHYAAQPPRAAPGKTDPALAKRGRQLAAKLRCGVCHLKDFSGQQQVPRLAGQREDYLLPVMRALRDNPPPGVDTQMSAVLYGVPDADLRALAHFLARRP
jgi:cytochrome c553